MPDFFSDLYADFRLDTRDEQTAAEVALVLDRLPKPARILDVACGRGRTAIALAAQGATVTACDVNPGYLRELTGRADAAGVELTAEQRDYRDLGHTAAFEGVTCVFASFGYHDDVTNRGVLAGMVEALVRGGRLFLEVQNRDYDLGARTRVARHAARPGLETIIDSTFDLGTSVRETRYRYIVDGVVQDGGTLGIRMYCLHELLALCRETGLEVEEIFGSVAQEPFTRNSKQIVIVGRRVR